MNRFTHSERLNLSFSNLNNQASEHALTQTFGQTYRYVLYLNSYIYIYLHVCYKFFLSMHRHRGAIIFTRTKILGVSLFNKIYG